MKDNLYWHIFPQDYYGGPNDPLFDQGDWIRAVNEEPRLKWREDQSEALYTELQEENRLGQLADYFVLENGNAKSFLCFCCMNGLASVSIYTSGKPGALNPETIELIYDMAQRLGGKVCEEGIGHLSEAARMVIRKDNAYALMERIRAGEFTDRRSAAELVAEHRQLAQLLQMQISFENPGLRLKYNLSGVRRLEKLLDNIRRGLELPEPAPDILPDVKKSIAAFVGETIVCNTRTSNWVVVSEPDIFGIRLRDARTVVPIDVVEVAIKEEKAGYLSRWVEEIINGDPENRGWFRRLFR